VFEAEVEDRAHLMAAVGAEADRQPDARHNLQSVFEVVGPPNSGADVEIVL